MDGVAQAAQVSGVAKNDESQKTPENKSEFYSLAAETECRRIDPAAPPRRFRARFTAQECRKAPDDNRHLYLKLLEIGPSAFVFLFIFIFFAHLPRFSRSPQRCTSDENRSSSNAIFFFLLETIVYSLALSGRQVPIKVSGFKKAVLKLESLLRFTGEKNFKFQVTKAVQVLGASSHAGRASIERASIRRREKRKFENTTKVRRKLESSALPDRALICIKTNEKKTTRSTLKDSYRKSRNKSKRTA